MRGIPLNEINVENEFGVKFASWVLDKLPDLETDRHDLSTLQKALLTAAGGNTELAGRLLKDLVVDNALNAAILNRLITEMRNKLKGPKAGGAKTAKTLKAQNESRNKDIRATAVQMLADGHDPRSINGKLATRYKLTARQIARIRQKE